MFSLIRRQAKTPLTIIVTLLLLITAVACSSRSGESSSSSSDGSPAAAATSPSFAGRLLLLQYDGPKARRVVELNAEAEAPQILWPDLPFSFGNPSQDYYTINPVVSADAKYVLLPGSLAVADLTTGEFADVPLPEGAREAMNNAKNHTSLISAFSPDGRYLAFALSGREHSVYAKSGLYVLELGTGAVKTLFEGPSTQYMGEGTACGGVGPPAWLDETTLAFCHFVGEMPRKVTFPLMPELNPNHTTIMSVEGSILQEFDQALGISVRGQTAIIRSDSGVGWLEVADFLKGTVNATSLDSDANAWIEFSPDGSFAYYVDQGKLLELRTGSTSTVASFPIGKSILLWSPDGAYVAVWNKISDELYACSLDGSAATLLADLDAVSERSDWWPLAWSVLSASE